MTAKQFFTSNAFKCIIVLTCIALISGGLLAILNDVLYISEEERTKQAIKKIYGQELNYTEIELTDEVANNQYGVINNVYKLEDNNYLIKSTGNEGYKGGTVTLWIVAEFADNNFVGLKKVQVAEFNKQTLMSSFVKSYYDNFTSNNDKVISGAFFDKTAGTNSDGAENIGVVNSGATFSSNAINRAVNCALTYIRTNLV